VIFNGGSSFASTIAKNADFSQEMIDVDGDCKRLTLNAYGIPPQTGVPVPIPDSEEASVPVVSKDANKRSIVIRYWWDESQKSFRAKVVYEESKMVMDQTRFVDDNDVLHFKNTGTKVDGSTCSFEATMKRSK
jgi:hypothetical protein